MQVDVTTQTVKPQFEPVEVRITLQTEEELQAMLGNLSSNINYFTRFTVNFRIADIISDTIRKHLGRIVKS